MSEISDAIPAKCLAFGDRIIKLNDYLLEKASQKYDAGRQKYGMRKGKSSFSHQTSDLSKPSAFRHQPSSLVMKTPSRRLKIKMSSRVPRYQNVQKIGGFCNLLFKSSHIGEDLEGVDVSWFVLCARE